MIQLPTVSSVASEISGHFSVSSDDLFLAVHDTGTWTILRHLRSVPDRTHTYFARIEFGTDCHALAEHALGVISDAYLEHLDYGVLQNLATL